MVTRKRRITLFTGTRADYGLLRPLALQLKGMHDVDLSFLVSGAHLSEQHGLTVREIDADGFDHQERVAILDGDDSDLGIAAAIGRGVTGYAAALRRLQSDILVILGDRYEALAAAIAATVCTVPVAHIHGGELSFGAMDDVFRHSITKMSHLHFCATEPYRQRVIQLGEHPVRVFHTGAPGVENALNLPLASRDETAARLGLRPDQPYILATFHPATLEAASPADQLTMLLDVLAEQDGYVSVFTGANADAHGQELNLLLEARTKAAPKRFRYFTSLGVRFYLSAVRDATLVVGNSSSGLIEVPSFGIPTVNIGSRQNGRTMADSVICCPATREGIRSAVAEALRPETRAAARTVANPYGKPGTSRLIAETLRHVTLEGLVNKGFYDVPAPPR